MNATTKTASYVGQRATIRTRLWGVVSGTVVHEVLYPWCAGANKIDIMLDEGQTQVPCHIVSSAPWGNTTILAETGDVEACHARYVAHLSQYPIWAERFAQNPDLNLFGATPVKRASA